MLPEVSNRLPEVSDSQHSTIAQHEGQPCGREAGRQIDVEACIAVSPTVTQLVSDQSIIDHVLLIISLCACACR